MKCLMIIVRTLFMTRIAIFIFPVDITHSALASLSLNMLTVQLRWCFLDSLTITFPFFTKLIHPISAVLVTQPMLHRQPNQTELRSMDSYIQILCRFQKSKLKFPPPSLPCTENAHFTPQKRERILLWEVKGDFLVQGSDGGGTFCLLIWNLHKIWI